MSFITISVIALGLAMDAFAVSITSGITLKDLRIRNAATIALFFGSFQAFMPLIGWLAGLSARAFITGVDHWIAFGLLSLIGCKMIYESTKLGPDENKLDPLNILVLLFLAIATSIDALAVGLSLSFLKIAIFTPALIIGAITFLLSFFGVFLGNISGHFFENKIEIIGGLILIGIGIKIVIEHIVLDVA
jgi:putative Mn2+ efflux pump MntP